MELDKPYHLKWNLTITQTTTNNNNIAINNNNNDINNRMKGSLCKFTTSRNLDPADARHELSR